jgi:cytochrome P450
MATMTGHVYSFLITLTGAISLITVILLLYVVIKCRLALWQFKRKNNGLPMYDKLHLLGNTMFTLAVAPNSCNLVDQAHKRLGKTFGWLSTTRYGVHTTDLELLKRVVIDLGEINRIKTDFPLQEIENSLLFAEDDQWRKLRRNFAPAFKSSKFKTQNVLDEIDGSIQLLIDHIESRLNEAQKEVMVKFEADDLMHRLSLQVMFSCFYKQYNLINFADEQCYWANMIEDMTKAVRSHLLPKITLLLPSLNPSVDWLIRNFHPQGAWRRAILEFIRQQTQLALEARDHLYNTTRDNKKMKRVRKIDRDNFKLTDGKQFKRNMIDSVIDNYLDGKLTQDEFFNSSFLILLAADKTTADAMVHLMYLLAIHPNEQEQCRESIKHDGYEAPYLSWSINETLRLLPPVPAGCSRLVNRDLTIDNGHVIPAGSLVISSTFTIHRLREYWGEDADEFNPMRWKDTKHHHPLQYIPFGYGQRGCIGKEFALFVMKKVFAALLTRYKLEAKERDDAYVFDAIYLSTIIPNSKTFVTIKRLEEIS